MDMTMEIQTELGLRIRYYRKQQKISQETLAELATLHPTYIGQLERGEKNATIESLYHIARALNITLSQLLADIENISDNTERKTFIPIDIYYKIIEIPPKKQKQLFRIIDAILAFSET